MTAIVKKSLIRVLIVEKKGSAQRHCCHFPPLHRHLRKYFSLGVSASVLHEEKSYSTERGKHHELATDEQELRGVGGTSDEITMARGNARRRSTVPDRSYMVEHTTLNGSNDERYSASCRRTYASGSETSRTGNRTGGSRSKTSRGRCYPGTKCDHAGYGREGTRGRRDAGHPREMT